MTPIDSSPVARPRSRLVLLVVALAAALTACGDDNPLPTEADTATTAPPPAVFADPGLEAAVRNALQAPTAVLDSTDLLQVTRLPAPAYGIRSLAGIERLRNLTVLDVADNRIHDLSPLSSLVHLVFLDLENNRVTSIIPLRPLARLEFVGLSYNEVENIAPLLSLPRLGSVSLEGTPLSEVSRTTYLDALAARGVQLSAGLSGLGAAPDDDGAIVVFESFDLEQRVRSVVGKSLDDYPQDLTRADVKNVRIFSVGSLGVDDISGLEFMTGLFTLNLTGNQVEDLWPLSRLTGLRTLTVAGNLVEDLEPVAAMTGLIFLNLQNNRVRDLGPLKALTALTTLYLADNEITDISPLLALPALRTLTLYDNPLDETSSTTHIDTLRARGVNVRY